jgi:hypothetical protein
MPPFPLFTSIKPPTNAGELADLSDCLDSWRAAGFHPMAVNGPREAETLRKLDLGIEFTPLRSDGEPGIGAILPPIWLFHCRPQTVAMMAPEGCELETLLPFGGHSLYALARTQAELARTQAALGHICNSTRWRMTAPLRRRVVALREIPPSPELNGSDSGDASGRTCDRAHGSGRQASYQIEHGSRRVKSSMSTMPSVAFAVLRWRTPR